MLEYHPICLAGTPRRMRSAEAVELHSFAVFRDPEEQILGFALSDGEINSPVLGLALDKEARRVWVRPEREDRVYYLPLELLPEDAIAALERAQQAEKPFSIFALNAIDEPESQPSEVSA